VHLFGALFGLAASKFLHCGGVRSSKRAPVYHSDLFALIGTLFFWVYYPSFNSVLSKGDEVAQMRAIINTIAAISASCVVTFGVSSLAGKGKLNVLHIQHATLAGGIAIGSVADLNVQIYVALIVGAAAGLLATVGYQYIDPFLARVVKLHDTCSVFSLHAIPGFIAAVLGIVFALCSTKAEYAADLYRIYPQMAPAPDSDEYTKLSLSGPGGSGRSNATQALFQLAAFGVTVGVALLFGALTGLLLRLPIFEQLSQEVEMFDDEAQWVTPDDYALKLTFAAAPQQPAAHVEEKKEDSKV
jgi:ammonium transporter Rh